MLELGLGENMKETCKTCELREDIEGKNDMVGCKYDKELHNIEDSCCFYVTNLMHAFMNAVFEYN